MDAPLRLEILTYAPTAFFQCRPCEMVLDDVGVARGIREDQTAEGLPPDLLEEYARVSEWVRRVAAEHGGRIALDLIDVASVRGFWKTLRHRVHGYPAVIVNGRVAPSLDAAEAAIDELLASSSA
jgi:hypothetical protein